MLKNPKIQSTKPTIVPHFTYYARSDDGIDEVESGTSNRAGVLLLGFSNRFIFIIYQRLLLHYFIFLENWLFFVITMGKRGGGGGGGGGKGEEGGGGRALIVEIK